MENQEKKEEQIAEEKIENKDKKKKHMQEGKNTGKRIAIIFTVILIIVNILAWGYLVYDSFFRNENQEVIAEEVEEIPEVEEVKTVQIYQGTDRPIAVMIDNHKDALPQGGLNDAYMVYEIIVEGGESRLMALFKGVEPEQIGPVRSSRHYFLDYALENDAIYAHFGWSPQAQYDISALESSSSSSGADNDGAERTIVDKTYHEDCGTGKGYWVITYSDGSTAVE